MKKTIDLAWLKEKDACGEGVEWFRNQKKTDAIEVLKALIKENQLDWANWTIVRVMERKSYLQYAIFSAEQVLHIFEKKYPEDKRPRRAIEAAKKVLENDTADNRKAAYAADAAYAAYAAYAAAAADAAAYAAGAAAYAAAAAAAYAAAYAAAAAAGRAKKAMKLKILEYGMSLLEKEAVPTAQDGK